MDKLEEAIKLLGDINPEVRKQAVRDLGDIRDVRAVDPLLPVCNDKDVEVRRIAIEALGKIGDARAILCMGRTYLGKGPSHRYDCPVIDLREVKEEDKLFVAQAILQIGPSAVDVLIDIVENQGGYDYYHPANSYTCWQVALLALWMSRDVRSVEVINRLLEHKDPHVRGRFVGFLEGRTENRARAFLVSALDNNDKEVRVNAAKALGIPYTIKVIGVGGAGKYALNRMIDTRLYCVEFIAMDFYPDCLAESKAANKLLMEQTHRNWPIGEFGELSRICKHESALDGHEQIRRAIGKANIVLIVAGMGGGTGSGVAPVIAETARETGALTIGVITTPFTFEGQGAHRLANKGIEALLNHVDTLIAISDAAIEKTFGNNKVSVNEAFQAADDYLRLAVRL